MNTQFQAFSDELIKINQAKANRLSKLERSMKPGDIILTTKGLSRPKGVLDRTELFIGENIAHVGRKYHHAGIYAGDGRIVDMRITGLKERGLDSLGEASVQVFRPKLPEKDKLLAVRRMRAMSGKSYATPQVIKATAGYIAGIKGDTKAPAEELICTGAVAEAYEGKLDFGRRRDIVGPWDIANSDKLRYVTHSKGSY